MTLGQLVDYCIEYNDIHGMTADTSKKQKKGKRRAATQADWNMLLG